MPIFWPSESATTIIAREARTLGHCALEQSDVESARRYFLEAVRRFIELDSPAEVVRSEWGLGRCLTREGEHREAVTVLESVAKRFENMGMTIDVALVTLDAMLSLLAIGETRDIASRAARLIRLFMDAGMLTSALTAFAYLREAALAEKLTPGLVDHVRRFVKHTESHPASTFSAPPANLN